VSALEWQFFWGFAIMFTFGHASGWLLGYTWGKYRQWLRTREISRAAESVLYGATTSYSKDPEYWTATPKEYMNVLDRVLEGKDA
jgi:hypothetical protein